jgi:hypothetical protein
MLTMKLDPDRILGLSGVGPKAMQTIEAALASATFPEPEKPVVVEEELVPEVETPEAATEVLPEGEIEPVVEEGVLEPVLEEGAVMVDEKAPVKEAIEEKEEEEEEEKDFEKLFTLENVITQVPSNVEEEEGQGDKKDAKKKGRKDRVIVFDEERGQAVARKKHKRGDEVIDDEW